MPFRDTPGDTQIVGAEIAAVVQGGAGAGRREHAAGSMRAVNWAETAFGPRDAWPPALQEAAAICLDAAAPMAIYWGEDFRLLYNDAWAPFLADRHPGALGQPARHVWPEIWNELEPDFARVMASGEGSRRERQRFFLSRPDGPAETFWDYSFNPIRDARGAVAGILNVSVESTALVAAEQRLKENKAFLRVVLDNSVNGLYGVDRDGTTTFCNSTFLTMLGFRAEADAIGRRLHDVIHHSRADGSAYAKVDCPIYTTAQTGVPAHVVDEVFFRLDGTSFPVEYWVRPILQDGAVQGAVCTFVDLTARRRAEQALRESEMRFRLVADSAPVPMWMTRLDGKRIFVNRAYAAFLGVSYEEALAFDWRALVHPDDLGRLVAAAETHPTELVSMEARYRTPAGTWRWLHSESQPRWDESGAHVGYIGVAYDVTCAKQAALDLEALNATLEARVEARTRERDRAWKHSQDLQVVLNPHGIILAANEAWRAILGWAPEEVVGRHHLDFVQQSFHGAAAGALAAAMLAELPALEVLHRHKNGGTRWISWVAAPADGLVYASGRNITAEKEAAAALEAAQEQLRQSQKMEAVGQLTGGIAHDFNNLLTGITGSLEVLQTRLAQGRVAEAGRYIAAAQGAARRAGALTHRLLAFSRRQTLDPRVTDVNHLVAGMEELIRRTVGPSIVTEFIGAAGLWTTLVDRNQLENALLNLCINARDAMQDGGRLTIETMNTVLDARGARDHDLQPGQYVSLCVSDTGTGMAPEVIARAFDPFFTTKPIGQGTGLGLSMIYGFARQSGGQVRIHSLLGHGTTMCLYLPRHAGPGADVEERETRIPASRAGHGETVLVIDDEATVRTLVVEVLEELGYATLQAPDGRTAMALLESDCAIDLLVTDLGLPGGMSGRQVADQARLVRPGLKVLIITGYPKGEAPGDDPLHEGVAVLMKPFTLDALAVRIKSLIGAQGLAPGG